MAEKQAPKDEKKIIEATPEETEKLEKSEENKTKETGQVRKQYKRLTREELEEQERQRALNEWAPKTRLGKDVLSGKETKIDEILSERKKILEPEIVDKLLPIETDLILIGQAKGKFGGGKRRAWRQTQKKTKEGNILSFSCMAVVGDRAGHIGVGFGRAKETLPSRAKAIRNAKLNLIKIKRGFETPEEKGNKPHTVPFRVEGKAGSIRIKLIPAPRGTGLVVGDECKKILKLAGIEDVYSLTKGHTKTTFNLAKACLNALSKTTEGII